MYKPAFSPEYRYIRCKYPTEFHLKCPICEAPVIFLYPDAGKEVYMLEETIYQVMEYYRCSNENCALSAIPFNPCPRFDYGTRHWGRDVFNYIAHEFLPPFKQKPEQIKARLAEAYPNFKISIDSIERICDDVLKLKAFAIDEKTREMILKNGCILLGFDAQDPGGDGPGIWNFMDLLTNRVLATIQWESVDYIKLHTYLEELFRRYPVKVLGWVSDKQNVIMKCHDVYYSAVPHQYCQYHFITHLWDHMTSLDSQVFIPLKKCLEALYIHKASTIKPIFFEGVGLKSPREVFQEIDHDFQMMIKAKNKKFSTLRGEWLYKTLDTYIMGVEARIAEMNPELRFTKIARKMASTIRESLLSVKAIFEEVQRLHQWFETVRGILAAENTPWQEQQRQIDEVYTLVYAHAQSLDPHFTLETCRAFQKSKNHTVVQILGEWCRLWNSYLPGLFKYQEFPGQFRTNIALEHSFSLEKQALIARVGKGIVRHMVETRGEPYLRLTHCTPEELKENLIGNPNRALLPIFRSELEELIHRSTARWRSMSRQYCAFHGVSIHYEKQAESVSVL